MYFQITVQDKTKNKNSTQHSTVFILLITLNNAKLIYMTDCHYDGTIEVCVNRISVE